jgi:hypothetical protein
MTTRKANAVATAREMAPERPAATFAVALFLMLDEFCWLTYASLTPSTKAFSLWLRLGAVEGGSIPDARLSRHVQLTRKIWRFILMAMAGLIEAGFQ